MAKHKYRTTGLWEETIRNLKLIAALTNKSMVEVADELVRRELDKVQGKEEDESNSESHV